MLSSGILLENKGHAQEGQFQECQLEHTMKQLRAMASGILAVEEE
jgi:hypothetical protein